MRILIVDDDLINRKFLKAMLTGYGEITMAEDGEAAIALFRDGIEHNAPFNIIFLDIMMPKMDGYETCRQLKADESTRDIPVVFLTAKAQEKEIDEGLKLGSMDYLKKPFEPDEFVEKVRSLIQNIG